MRALAALLLWLHVGVGHAADQTVNDLLRLAIGNLNSGHYSTGIEYLEAIVAKDPTHPEALWQLTWQSLSGLGNQPVEDRATTLLYVSPAVLEIHRIAQERNDPGFAHYVMARYSRFYNAFDRALAEIDKALQFAPDSTRYLMMKGLLLTWQGDWEGSDEIIGAGVVIIEQARRQSQRFPTMYWSESDFHAKKAQALGLMYYPPWDLVISAYTSSIETATPADGSQSYSWNSLSWALRNAGRCIEAEKVARRTLEIADSESARKTLIYAEFCLELQTLDLLADTSAKSIQ